MAIPASGAVSFSDINREFSRSSTATISLSNTRTHYMSTGTASGQANFNGFHGKSGNVTVTFASSIIGTTTDVGPYVTSWNSNYQSIYVIVNAGVTLCGQSGSNNPVGTYRGASEGLKFNSATFPGTPTSFPYGVYLINNGTISGGGGWGAQGGNFSFDGFDGSSGANGLLVTGTGMNLSITNNGTIAGGGGGGAGGAGGVQYQCGGGGGGGAGFGVGGADGNSGQSSSQGSNGTATTGGAGGPPQGGGHVGAAGGNLGQAGSNASYVIDPRWAAKGGPAGNSVVTSTTSGASVTYVVTGTLLGATKNI